MDSNLKSVWNNVVRISFELGNQAGSGTGLLTNDNLVLTCDHVVNPKVLHAEKIYVNKDRGLPKRAELVDFDSYHDLATLRVNDFENSSEINYSDNEIEVGEDCFILGYPIGIRNLSLSKATISAKGSGLVSNFPFEIFQVDSRVNHGNSGGQLVNDNDYEIKVTCYDIHLLPNQ